MNPSNREPPPTASPGPSGPEPSTPFPLLYPDRTAVEHAFARHVSRGKVDLFRSVGLELVMGWREGGRFADAYTGRTWFDCHSNGGVYNLGHRHPRVVDAFRTALDHLDIGNHHLISGHRALLAERLAATTGDRLPGVVFAAGGGEAVDVAIKAARAATGRTGVVSARGGYHGHTGLAMAAGDPQYRERFGPNLPGFRQVPFDDRRAMEEAVDENTAAVILEPIPATLGMPLPSPDYLPFVSDLCRRRGAAFIVDEVQTGLGRTGRLWACEHDGVTPDLLVTGKGLGGGVFPIAATLMGPKYHRLFHEQPFVHVSTFGGAELGCAAALTVLDVVQEPGFLARVAARGERFREALADLPCEFRGRGLMMGLAFGGEAEATLALLALHRHGIFCLPANNDRRVVQLLPPLVMDDDLAGALPALIAAAIRSTVR